MSRDRSKPFESTVSISIIPDVSGLMAAFSRVENSLRVLSKTLARQSQRPDLNLRYWNTPDGRTYRNPSKNPLLHNGRKPRK